MRAVVLTHALVLAAACGTADEPTAPPVDAPQSDASSARPDAGPGRDAGGSGSSSGGSTDAASGVTPRLLVPRTGLAAAELGVVINDDDPLSAQVAAYYMQARAIPASNVVHVQLGISNQTSEAKLTAARTAIDSAFGPTIQALALVWTKPYGVGAMSITTAFSLGYHAIADTCTDPISQGGTPNPYTGHHDSTQPFTELSFRPAMVLPFTSIDDAKALVDRGVAADETWPTGRAYLMKTTDGTRSARCVSNPTYGYTNECQTLLDEWDSTGSGIGASIVEANSVANATDVMFYVQGLATVPDVDTNTYLPGAVADHLTSHGGSIPTSGQMSAFVFLTAGATGSFGTVAEPCAYQQKFPDPSVLVPAYFAGNTLVEAYWKSVLWPAEGLFIGEPLARPWGTGFRSSFADGTLLIETTTLEPGKTYALEAADAESGPFDLVQDDVAVPRYTRTELTVPAATRSFYRLRAK